MALLSSDSYMYTFKLLKVVHNDFQHFFSNKWVLMLVFNMLWSLWWCKRLTRSPLDATLVWSNTAYIVHVRATNEDIVEEGIDATLFWNRFPMQWSLYWVETLRTFTSVHLRTFALIVSRHSYCACKFTCLVMYRAHVISTKMNNDRADGHCYSFA